MVGKRTKKEQLDGGVRRTGLALCFQPPSLTHTKDRGWAGTDRKGIMADAKGLRPNARYLLVG